MSTPTGSEEYVTSTSVGPKDGDPFCAVYRHRLPKEPEDARGGADPVLVIHAATLGARMFLQPKGGFVKHLLAEQTGGRPRFDVFTLDWRSSNLLFGNDAKGGEGRGPDDYRIDCVAEHDVPVGLGRVAELHPGKPVRIVAHCLGAAATAQAIASGKIGGDEGPPLGPIVMATIALFYKLGIDGWLKVADNIMRDVEALKPPVIGVSPHVVFDPKGLAWPGSLEKMFQVWANSIFPHNCGQDFCNRLWFLYGGDYRSDDLDGMHEAAVLKEHFGAFPVGLCRHIIDNCQRGWAAPWNARKSKELLKPKRFAGRKLTLITGSENQVWHRDSIDRMYEWLRRELGDDARDIEKRVFDRYGHVDLWWSKNSPDDVFKYVVSRLQ